MSDEEIDEACDEAIRDGWPFCPWIGQPEYGEHSKRRMAEGMRLMRESVIMLQEALRDYGK